MRRQGSAGLQAQREIEWRDRLVRQVASGQSIAEFCRSEGITEGTFYGWRARLRARNANTAPAEETTKRPAAFIDIGAINGLDANKPMTLADDRRGYAGGKIEVRIDLGPGVVLQILQR